jgi:hypothetical protein
MMGVRLPRARIDGLVIRELDDETLVYDTVRDKAHCLNRTAALVWGECDGKTTAREVAGTLRSKFNVPVEEDIVWLAIKQLEQFHLIERQSNLPLVSRRKIILKYAPAALALPVIMSISAPTPAVAASCGGSGAPCGGQFPPCCRGFGCIGSPSTCQGG